MFSHKVQLACTLLLLSLIHLVQCQASSTATENGIVSAAGGPNPTQRVSYIIGTVPVSAVTYPTATATHDANPLDNAESSNANEREGRLGAPAIIGITLAIIFAVAGIILVSVFMHKRRREALAREQRRTILDAEFAPSKEKVLYMTPDMQQRKPSDSEGKIGYFDVAKPLPIVKEEPVEDDRLSRSSTIIADAAEVAKINRNASCDQEKGKKQKSTTRERNLALQTLVGNAHCGDAKADAPRPKPARRRTLDMFPPTPTTLHFEGGYQAACTDGNGDAFANRPDKI